MSVEMNGRRRFNWKVSLTMVEGPTRLSRVVGTFLGFLFGKSLYVTTNAVYLSLILKAQKILFSILEHLFRFLF